MGRLSAITTVFLVVIFAGCAVHAPVSRDYEEQKIEALAADLVALGAAVDISSASQVARRAVRYSRQLAERYELSGSPRLHNLMVNLGLRDRGLCYQWADDLLAELLAINSDQFDFYSAVANRGSDLLEHNSVVVTEKGGAFEAGIVLDGWRNSGDLFWVAVKQDSYIWQPRYPFPGVPEQP